MKHLVHIIESPHDTDLLEDRQERMALRHALALAGVPTREYLVVSQKAFVMALKQIAATDVLKHSPVLHLSAHGNARGIELTSGDSFTWDEMKGVFAKVNEALNGGLLLCMSTCEGRAALKMIANKRDPAPFHTLVGPKKNVDWRDSLVAFTTFYHLVITHGEEPSAVEERMNGAAGLAKGTFAAITSAQVTAFHEQRERRELAARLVRIAEKLAKKHGL